MELAPDFMRRIQRLSVEARMRKLSPEQRSAIALRSVTLAPLSDRRGRDCLTEKARREFRPLL